MWGSTCCHTPCVSWTHWGCCRDGRAREPVVGRALIAADGIHSAIRRAHYPNEGPPRWNGAIMWRAVTDAPPYLDGHTMIMAGHRDVNFVCYPIGSNGASQAILDARVLTGCLVEYGDDVDATLARYENIRRPSTAAIVKANREMGPELPMQLVEERAPDGFSRLQDVISDEELATIAERYKKVELRAGCVNPGD